ncbi:hypothetical protein Tco_1373869 [Tanacetum coccineum]
MSGEMVAWCCCWWQHGGCEGGAAAAVTVDGGDAGGGERRVEARVRVDRVDRNNGESFGLRRKNPPEKFSGGGGGGRRQPEKMSGRESEFVCVYIKDGNEMK